MQDTPPENPESNSEDRPLQNNGNNVRASWNFSLDDVRRSLAHCDPEAKEVMIAAFLWCIDDRHPVTLPEFSDAIDYDPSTVGRIYRGKYENPTTKVRLDVPKKMVAATRAWLRDQRAIFLQTRPKFCITPTSERIFAGCDLARESHSPVFILGPSHLGKTWSLEHYTAENNHGRTIYVRMEAASGLGGMVKAIAKSLGVADKSNTRGLIERIKNAMDSKMVLIVDELHLLAYTYRRESFFACLEVIREIYDAVECGLVLCGTLLLLDKMGEGKHSEMEQLLRRGVHKIRLPGMPTKEDLTVIFQRDGLSFPDRKLTIDIAVSKAKTVTEQPYALVRQLAKDSGLKAITERLRYAGKLSARAGEEISWTHFVDAHLRIKSQNIAPADWD